MSDPTTNPIIICRAVGKSFAGVTVLESVDFDLRPGEVHTLMGENGAGKSTLMKILAGVHRPGSGELLLDNVPVNVPSPLAAQKLGIALIHQEPLSFPDLSVAENIFMSGGSPQKEGKSQASPSWFVNWSAMYSEAAKILESLGVKLDPKAKVRGLSIADQQMVELAAALSQKAKVLLMDEPTAALTPEEVGDLFRIVRRLRDAGTAIVFISHRLEEVFSISDRITVLRDGHCIGTRNVKETTTDEIIRMMVGRELGKFFEKPPAQIGEPRLKVENLSSEGRFADITFEVRRGEILGVAGLVGAGRTDVGQSIFGIHSQSAGKVTLDGKPLNISSPRQAIDQGIAYVPEDRAHHGLLLPMSIATNTSIAELKKVSKFGWLSRKKDRHIAEEWRDKLRTRLRDVSQPARELSGGNQQKVVLSKWLLTEPQVLILDEPTRGIDVGAKAEVHHLMGELARQGKSILMISSDLPEVLAMSDRIIVMREGRITGRFDRSEATQEKIMAAATGQHSTLEAKPGPSGPGSPATPHPVRLRKTDASSSLLRFRELGIALFVLLTFFAATLKTRSMLAPETLSNILLFTPIIIVVAMGQMMVIISRNIDLSVGSILAFASIATCGIFVTHPGFPLPLAALLATVIGAAMGAINGTLIAYLRVPAIITTLGTLSAYRGLVFIYSGGRQVDSNYIPEALIDLSNRSAIYIPWIIVFAAMIAVLTALFLRYTRTGREIYAIGSNPHAAQMRGIPINRVLLLIFTLTGALSGLAGIFYASKFTFINPSKTGVEMELITISAAVIGGTNVFGGSGTVLGVLFGCLFLGLVNQAMPVVGINPFWQKAVYGVAILAAASLDTIIQKRFGKSA
ncbi:MAG TPA: ATP-binding cassette domain-containing protein [Tepidisphaeraceae bacterium]|jgi:ABC-type sugar transport system ATPase subunit/ribose/xylose/arabinose/galactoside ABC-type transport system permease subunit|nr:ATP-binding cassette domain-containing protein [Tepidisphaeraceae bacterium]